NSGELKLDYFPTRRSSDLGGQGQTGTRTKQKTNQRNGLLDQLGKNVTDDARAGLVDHVIGRDNEIKRVVETLNRRNKNNPVLIRSEEHTSELQSRFDLVCR